MAASPRHNKPLQQTAELLSHGHQRQLEIAVALGARPRLLLLDEPSSGMSAHERAGLADLGVRTWVTPRGGFYLWGRLPDGRDASDIARAALGEDAADDPVLHGDLHRLRHARGEFASSLDRCKVLVLELAR